MSHTPGPWEWWTSNSWNRLRHSNRGVSQNVLLPAVCPDGQPTIDVSAADMALIAAAPKLLAACKTLIECATIADEMLDAGKIEHEEIKMAIRLARKFVDDAEGRT